MMTARTKSALLLGATLAIGILLGALGNAWLADRRFERMGYLRSEHGFTRHLEEIVEPTSDSQRAAVRAILERQGERMQQHMERTREEGRSIMDSTHAALAKVLTPEQMRRLEQEMHHRAGPGHGPGPRGRGPGGQRRLPPDLR